MNLVEKGNLLEFAREWRIENGDGLTSNSGLMNGNGLTNGNGITDGNGLTDENGLPDGEIFEGKTMMSLFRKGKHRLLGALIYGNKKSSSACVLFVVFILIGISYITLLKDSRSGIELDGEFSDWDEVEMIRDTRATGNPHIDLIKYRALIDKTHLSLYMETRDDILRGLGEKGDTIQVFFDTDLDGRTGYAFPYFGADYLLEIYGRDTHVLSSYLYVFDEDYRSEEKRSTNDWNGWAPMFSIEVAAKDNKLETQLWRDELQIDGDDVALMIRLVDIAGNVAESLIFNPDMKTLIFTMKNTTTGPLLPYTLNDVLVLNVVPEGERIVLNGLIFEECSTAVTEDFDDVSLYKGEERIAEATTEGNTFLFEHLDMPFSGETTLALKMSLSSTAGSGHVLSLGLKDVDCGSAALNVEAEEIKAYLIAPPDDVVVDGLFDEWKSPEEDEDNEPAINPNTNITHHDAAIRSEQSFFYLRVHGRMLAGVGVPGSRAMVIDTGGISGGKSSEPGPAPQEETSLPVKTGEDAIYILLDTLPEHGYQNRNMDFGADSMIEIKGQHGIIISASYLTFDGEHSQEWRWNVVKDVEAFSGQKEIEMRIDEVPLNVCFHIISWCDEDDWAGASARNLTGLKGNRGGTDLVINEIYYGGDSSSHEWIELFNSGTSEVVIDGWAVDDGEGTWTIPNPEGDEYTLPAGEYIVLARNGASFYDNYGNYPDFEKEGDTQAVDLSTSGSLLLANTEEQLILNSTTSVIDFVAYDISSSHGSGWGVVRWAMTNDLWDESGGKDFVDTTSSWDSIARDSSSTDSDTPSDWSQFGDHDRPTPGEQNIEEFKNVLVPVGAVMAAVMVLRRRKRGKNSRTGLF